jgi:hypothetical protein
MMNSVTGFEPRLTTEDVRRLYGGVSVVTLCRWRRNLKMPHRRIGNACYYVASELREWDQAHVVNRPQIVTEPRPRSILAPVGSPSSGGNHG